MLIDDLSSFLGVMGCALEDDVDKENHGNWIFSKEGLDWVFGLRLGYVLSLAELLQTLLIREALT